MKPKIITTLGPASESTQILKQMALEGMSVARINFSHGNYREKSKKCAAIRHISKSINKKITILADLQGPKIRIGQITGGKVFLDTGQKFTINPEILSGTKKSVGVDYKDLPKYVTANDRIFIDDGKIELKVLKVKSENILCDVIVGGELYSRKGVTVFRKSLPLPAVTEQDRKDAEFAVMECGITHFAQSFVRKSEDILELRKFLGTLKSRQRYFIIAKIEDYDGYKNIDRIIKVADGIMVARGDLGVSVERALVPLIQKEIIEKCNLASIPDIVATQMLDSMINNRIPTRAEVNDVAVAVMQGADYLMLSAETAIGRNPVLAVKEMNNIVRTVTKYLSSSSPKIQQTL